mmetsp:Transcript_41280/g.110347  ORF Transcript_41280/g.110347 Transcript_41280/m.110347 type:complete len:581 (-) Transcript_41280:962-2704(-)
MSFSSALQQENATTKSASIMKEAISASGKSGSMAAGWFLLAEALYHGITSSSVCSFRLAGGKSPVFAIISAIDDIDEPMSTGLDQCPQLNEARRCLLAATRIVRDRMKTLPVSVLHKSPVPEPSKGVPPTNSDSMSTLMRKYASWHRESVRNCSRPRSIGQRQGRVLLYRPSSEGEGWGNRVLALASAFYLAIASQRVLLVDWGEPGPFSRWLSNPDFEWDAQGSGRCLLQGNEEDWVSIEIEDLFRRRALFQPDVGPNVLIYSSLHDLFRAIKVLPQFSSLRQMCSVVCNGQRCPGRGPAQSPQINENGGVDTPVLNKWELFGCVGRFIFRPSSQINQALQARRSLVFSRGARSSVVGLAIRRGSSSTSLYSVLHQGGEDRAIACASLLSIAGAQTHQRSNGPSTPLDAIIDRGKTVSFNHVFLTTDSEDTRGRAESALGSRLITSRLRVAYTGSGPKRAIFDASTGDLGDISSPLLSPRNKSQPGQTSNDSGLQDAIVDWFLLGEVQWAVVSAGSTFGQTGWARGREPGNPAWEVDNFSPDCAPGVEDGGTEVFDRACCARAAQASGDGKCPQQCRLA